MAGCAFDRFDKETRQIIVEEILVPQREAELAKPMRPRKTREDLSALLTWKGAKEWDGWKSFDHMSDTRRYKFQPEEKPTLGEMVEETAYTTMQAVYVAGLMSAIAAPILGGVYYFTK